VAEGSTKPEAQISFADTDEPVRLIAVLLPVTNKALRNQPFLRAYLNARLRLFVQMREDAQLLNGNGTAPNLKGILNRSGVNTATSYSIGGSNPDQALIDAVFHAAMRVRDSYLEPDAAVMKPATWEIAALAKDGNRNYLLGGPGASGYAGNDPISGPRLWGLRVVLNANMPAQAATNKPVLVGAWRTSAMVVRRGGIDLALSESHSTFFAENKVMLRAEEELALCVFRPAGFAAVTSAA
jgi:HK97 family phage major capsid protein